MVKPILSKESEDNFYYVTAKEYVRTLEAHQLFNWHGTVIGTEIYVYILLPISSVIFNVLSYPSYV